MPQSAHTGGRKDNQAALTLLELSEFVNIQDPELALAKLTDRGCVLAPPTAAWRPLSGGLEYNHYVADSISIDEVISTLLVEITRTSKRHDETWVNNFELGPSSSSQLDWVEKIRDVLKRDFELEPSTETHAETYARGGAGCLLIYGSATDPPRLLLHRRVETTPDDL